MRLLKFLIVILLISGTSYAAPKFPQLTGRVVDDAHVISAGTADSLTQTLADYETKTSQQVVVVTVPSLQGYSVEDYGYQLGRSWDIGQKGKDNGIILLVAPKEHKVRIEVGYGLESIMTDTIASQIIQTIILPDFRAGQMEKGISDGTQAILGVLNGSAVPQAQTTVVTKPHHAYNNIIGFAILFIFYIFISFVIMIINFITYVFYKVIGKPLPKRFTTDRFSSKGVLGKALYFSAITGGGFSSGSSSGGGFFSGGGGGFGGGGASGGW